MVLHLLKILKRLQLNHCFLMRRGFTKAIILFIVTLFCMSNYANAKGVNITYVNVMAKGLNNGESWDNAYTDLQSALNDPRSNEIWVAEGIYAPFKPLFDGSNGFYIDGFGAEGFVYGGFKGDEVARNERNPDIHHTLLEKNNQMSSMNNSVLFSSDESNNIVFDGFIVSTFVGDDKEIIDEIIVNTRLTNCWVGTILVNNLSDFTSGSNTSGGLKSFDEDGLNNSIISEGINFVVYPTIATTQITIESSIPSQVELIDYLGSIVFTTQMTDSPLRINVSDLPKGIYIARVTNLNFGVKTTRVVIK